MHLSSDLLMRASRCCCNLADGFNSTVCVRAVESWDGWADVLLVASVTNMQQRHDQTDAIISEKKQHHVRVPERWLIIMVNHHVTDVICNAWLKLQAVVLSNI